jgi:hypothetical protein
VQWLFLVIHEKGQDAVHRGVDLLWLPASHMPTFFFILGFGNLLKRGPTSKGERDDVEEKGQ